MFAAPRFGSAEPLVVPAEPTGGELRVSREVPLTRLGLEEAATGVTVPEPAAAMLAMPLAVAGEPTGSVELEVGVVALAGLVDELAATVELTAGGLTF